MSKTNNDENIDGQSLQDSPAVGGQEFGQNTEVNRYATNHTISEGITSSTGSLDSIRSGGSRCTNMADASAIPGDTEERKNNVGDTACIDDARSQEDINSTTSTADAKESAATSAPDEIGDASSSSRMDSIRGAKERVGSTQRPGAVAVGGANNEATLPGENHLSLGEEADEDRRVALNMDHAHLDVGTAEILVLPMDASPEQFKLQRQEEQEQQPPERINFDRLDNNMHATRQQNEDVGTDAQNLPTSEEEHATSSSNPRHLFDTQFSSVSNTTASTPSMPILQAELVIQPVEALEVAIDEESSMMQIEISDRGHYREQSPTDDDTTHLSRPGKSDRPQKYTPVFWSVILLIVVIIICSVTIPLVLSRENEKPELPVKAPIFPFLCYDNLLEIYRHQLSSAPTPNAYILCPNTRIKIGTFANPEADDYRFVDGDYPLLVARPNVTIQCGLDGRQENNCILDSGFAHMLILQRLLPQPEDNPGIETVDLNKEMTEGILVEPIDNMMIRGITFSGNPRNVGPLVGLSISLSHPGKNMRFEDCRWTDISTSGGLVGVYRNFFQIAVGLPLEDRTIDLTMSNCVFENIVFDTPLIYIISQSFHMERCVFRNIRPSILAASACDTIYEGERVNLPGSCAQLLNCALDSTCIFENVCIENFEWKGPGVVASHVQSSVDFQNVSFVRKAQLQNQISCEMIVGESVEFNSSFCVDIFENEHHLDRCQRTPFG